MKILILLILTTLSFGLYSQITPIDFNNILNKSKYIFEGEVIRSDCYWNVASDKIYTSHTVEISKIFKGNLVCGTVEIITEGGRVSDRGLYLSHGVELSKGDKGIFSCAETDYEQPISDFYVETNLQVLQLCYQTQGYFRYFDYGESISIQNNFYVFDSLTQIYDAIQQVSQVQYVECFPAVNKGNNKKHETQYYPKQFKIQNELELINIRANSPPKIQNACLKTTQTTSLVYQIDSIKTDGVFFEFDIMLSGDGNDAYLDNARAIIQFDTATFGSYIYANNAVLFVDRGIVISDINTYYSPVISDVSYNKIQIDMVALSSVQNRFNLTTTPQKAVHVVLQINGCSYGNNLTFANSATMLNSSYYTLSANSSSIYQFPTIDNFDTDIIPVFPCISDFYPKTIHAGVGELLTVKGIGFGSIQGQVQLAGSDYSQGYEDVDSIDFVTIWTDTSFVIKMPSIVYDNDSATSGKHSIGTGKIKVRPNNSLTFFISLENLTVDYGLICQRKNNGTKALTKSVSSDTLNKAYRFRLDSEVVSNPSRLACVKKAICDWSNATGIPFQLDSVLYDTDASAIDGINSIFMSKTETVFTQGLGSFMFTSRSPFFCSDTDESLIDEIDIAILDTNFWFYDETGLQNKPSNSYDFYGYLLHEMGHGHGFTHINDPNSLMYYADPFDSLPAFARHVIIDPNLVGAGQYILQVSQPDSVIGCDFAKLNLSTGCVILLANDKRELIPNIEIFPNPTSNLIEIKAHNHRVISYELFSLEGLKIKEESIISNNIEISMEYLLSGIYFLKIVTDHGVQTIKVIKQ